MSQVLPATEPADVIEAGVVELDGVKLWLAGQNPQNLRVQFSDLARFQPKILFGDPSKDDNDLLSVLQMSDFSGGHGVFELKEGTDQQRVNFSTLTTRFPSMLARPPYVTDNPNWDATGAQTPLCEVFAGGFMVMAIAGGNDIYITGTSGDYSELAYPATGSRHRGTMSAAPVGKGVAFQGTHSIGREQVYIPFGTGYAEVDPGAGGTLTNHTSPDFMAFTVWDNKLIGIDAAGQLYWSLVGDVWTGGTDGDSYGLTYKLPLSYQIRHLITYYDRQDEAAVFIVTDRDIWQFNPDGPELFRIDFGWPAHAYSGLGAAVWNGQLFVSVGMGVMRYSNGTWMPVGLDRDYGLPLRYQGYIADLAGGYNALYALVQSLDLDPDLGGSSSVHEFTGTGWHCIWRDDPVDPDGVSAPLSMTKLLYTGARDASGPQQSLVWGISDTPSGIYSMSLPLTFANPRALLGVDSSFAVDGLTFETYYWESGWFDADMFGYIKIANTWQIVIDDPKNAFAQTKIVLEYRIERGTDYLVLGTLPRGTVPGRHTFAFGEAITSDGGTTGMPFEEIQFRVKMVGAAHSTNMFTNRDRSVIITNQLFTFLKTVRSNDALTLAVDTSNGSADGTLGPRELETWLDGLTTIRRFLPLIVGQDEYRVFVSQNTGTRSTGDLQVGTRQLSLVEVPMGEL